MKSFPSACIAFLVLGFGIGSVAEYTLGPVRPTQEACAQSCPACPETQLLSQECMAAVKQANPLERFKARYVTFWRDGKCLVGEYLVNGQVKDCSTQPLANEQWKNVRVVGGLSIVDTGDGLGPRPYVDVVWQDDGK